VRGDCCSGANAESNSASSGSSSNDSETNFADLFLFEIEAPVSASRGSSAMVPMFCKPIHAARCLVYDYCLERTLPLAALYMRNDTGAVIENGVVSVTEDGNFVGESIIVNLRPGEEHYITYAVENAISVQREVTAKTLPAHAATVTKKQKVNPSLFDTPWVEVTVFNKRRTRTVYTFVNASERTMPFIQINHPLVDKNHTLLSAFEQRTRQPIAVEEVVDTTKPDAKPHAYHLWLELEPRGTATVVVLEEKVVQQLVVGPQSSLAGVETFVQRVRSGDEEYSTDLLTSAQIDLVLGTAKERHIASQRQAVTSTGDLPNTLAELQEKEERGVFWPDEAKMVTGVIELAARQSELQTQLEDEQELQKQVEETQARLRMNISALSIDGIRNNPLVTRYITAMDAEEDKLAASTQRAAALRESLREVTQQVSSKKQALLQLIKQRAVDARSEQMKQQHA
jgi:hypothetical protein